MKATGFRIGNYLKVVGKDEWLAIYGQHLVGWDTPLIGDEYATKEYLEPIPLTDEWLVKFGFKDDMLEFKLSNTINVDSYFMYSNGTVSYLVEDFWGSKPLIHVHQLQNLYFALTGEELTIK